MKRIATLKKLTILIGLLLVMVIVLGATGCAALKIKASVAGYVYMNESPMPNFEVQIWNATTMVASGKTNQQGHFMISDVPPGTYTVRVLTYSAAPHPHTIEITVRPGRTETFDIDLGGAKVPKPKIGM